MSFPYPKIQTFFERGPDFTVQPDCLRCPEFGLIKEWQVYQKYDGTSLRFMYSRNEEGGIDFSLGGRTNKAIFSDHLRNSFTDIGTGVLTDVEKLMNEFELNSYTIYGEGYGPGVQSGGYYRDDLGFVAFDIVAGEKRWATEDEITEATARLGLERAVFIPNPYCKGSPWILEEIVAFIRSGENKVVGGKDDRESEGIIARTAVPLFDRRGNRIITKLKASDFKAGKR